MDIIGFLHGLFMSSGTPTSPGVTATTPRGILSLLPQAIKAVAPSLSDTEVQAWAAAFVGPMTKAEINTPRRAAAFLGNMAVESGDFKAASENLNYSSQRLVQVWPNRFPSINAATPFAHNPQALANKVYNGRMGNEIGSDDGWRFRGGGPMQLTGRVNYTKFAESVNMTPEAAADYVRTKEGGAASACWYWSANKINAKADAWDLEAVTQAINGGQTGAAEREENAETDLKVFGGS